MRIFLIIAFFSLFMQTAQAQGRAVSGGDIRFRPIYLRDVFPNSMQPKGKAGIQGGVFVYDQWLMASLTLLDGRIADSIYIKLNAYNNCLHFLDENGEERQATIRVKRILIIDENTLWHNTAYLTGFPGNPNAFYQLIYDGPKLQVLKKITVILQETKVLGEEDKRSLLQEEEYFFTANGVLYKPGKQAESLSSVFGDKKDEMERFILSNELNCKRKADMEKVAEYFNGL